MSLEHSRQDDYDPVKAHQYYMLNRKLKPAIKTKQNISPFDKFKSIAKNVGDNITPDHLSNPFKTKTTVRSTVVRKDPSSEVTVNGMKFKSPEAAGKFLANKYLADNTIKGYKPKPQSKSLKELYNHKNVLEKGIAFLNRLFKQSTSPKGKTKTNKITGAKDYGVPSDGNWPKGYLR